MIRPLLRLATVGLLGLVLSGCVTLLPKTNPAQLYRFGPNASAAASPTMPNANAIGIFRAPGSFPIEAGNDRLMTVTGGKVAYIADSRWVAPATLLFDEAVANAFETAPPTLRLAPRGSDTQISYLLRLDVRNFEADYVAGSKAPIVVVRIRAALTRRDHTVAGDQMFEARIPASENRVGAIVQAYDKALSEVLTKIIGWTSQTAV